MFVENTISIYASNVVFFIMLSFFPFAMFFFTILKYIPGITQGNLIPMIGSVVPGELGDKNAFSCVVVFQKRKKRI